MKIHKKGEENFKGTRHCRKGDLAENPVAGLEIFSLPSRAKAFSDRWLLPQSVHVKFEGF